MFYSHEILQNRQYGVATIWLVANIPNKSNFRRVGKKAIETVDLSRACEKIIQPGAPIALRLQSSLLLGVSRVYKEQTQYMLSDIQKIQGHMTAFLRQFGANQANPADVRAKPESLILMDDPDFFPDGNLLPDPTAEMFNFFQSSNKNSSQMSPHSLQSSGGSSGNEQFSVQLDLRESSVIGPGGSQCGLPALSSAQKPPLGGDDNVIGDEFEGPMDFGIQIDEDGNIVELPEPGLAIVDEPDLPPLPVVRNSEGAGGHHVQQHPQVDEQGDSYMMDEQSLPEAQALPARQDAVGVEQDNDSEHLNERPTIASRQRKRRLIRFDEDTEIPRQVMSDWQTNYLANCGKQRTNAVSATQARNNAIHLTFGLGIGNIGQSIGIPGMIHPLALEFSGDSLYTTYTGLDIPGRKSHKRNRSASETIEDDEEGEQRRVKARLEEDGNQQGRGSDGEDGIDLGLHHSPSEVAREAQSAMDDNPSSAMPWNRGSSLMPGSSAQKGGSVQPGRDLSSPLGRRGNAQDIVGYSSDPIMGGSMDFGADGGLRSDSLDGPHFDDVEPEPAASQEDRSTQEQNQHLRDALDRQSTNFLGFIEEEIRANGERRHDDDFDRSRKWIGFDDIFVPETTERSTAAQAFYHVLTLVTKGQMVVEQDGVGQEPYGSIHVGLNLSRDA